jgi:hypothetical protein
MEGQLIEVSVQGEPPRVFTPHKAIRRVADHLVDHFAELEARPTEPDCWDASSMTNLADLTAFTSADLDEARSRLRQLALIRDVRLRSLSDRQLDDNASDARTLRRVAFHVAESAFYADVVGRLGKG